jgi:outer membrane protein
MKKYLCLILFLVLITPALNAQQKAWTLLECIRYALDNNIQIKQQGIQTRYQENALDLAKFRLLPTINGSASHNYSFGRALDQTTYQYTDNETILSDNLYFSSSLTLFNGLQNQNTIKRSRYDLLASEEDYKTISDNVALNVALAYLQILLNREIVTATANQLAITNEQIGKTRKLVDAGSIARGNLLQIEAQAAQEELQLINIKNQYDISILNITQLLELPSAENFSISVPDIPLDTNTVIQGNLNEIYNAALGNRPEVKGSEFRLYSSEYDLKISQGARSPRLSLSNTFSTGYSDVRRKLLGIDQNGPIYGEYPFSEQIERQHQLWYRLFFEHPYS